MKGKLVLFILVLFGAGCIIRGSIAAHNGVLVNIGHGRGGGADQFIHPAAAIEIGCLMVGAAILYSFVGPTKKKPGVDGSSPDAK